MTVYNQAAEAIYGALDEIIAMLQFLRTAAPLDNARWHEAEEQFAQIMLARARLCEGEYQIAIEHLPTF